MIFTASGPRWFTIDADRPFLDDLARGLLGELGGHGPEALADAIVLTPTRRGARALAEAFVSAVGGAAGGRALLLPQIRAIGDLDEGEPPFEPGDLALDLPPAISPMRRRFELARLVLAHPQLVKHRTLDAGAALELADALASLLDSAQIEEVSPEARLDGLVPAELARHWQDSAAFLELALRAWPERLAELGLADVNSRRIALLRALGAQWDARPPERPLIAAGSTGTAPATAALLQVIAAGPQGAVVLPGLDQSLAETAWAEVGEAHPQGSMKRLLAGAGVPREAVRVWPRPEEGTGALRGRWRRRVINEALRPAKATSDWRAQISELRKEGEGDDVDPIAEGLQGLSVLRARNDEEAATAISLLLRETLETPGATAALVTPDQDLARRVSARLSRWGVEADTSAGTPLAGFPVAVLLASVARATAEPLDPARKLAILKHRFARLGRDHERLGPARRALERRAFRGPRRESWEAVDAALERRAEAERAREEPLPDQLTALQGAADLARDLRAVLERAAAPFWNEAGATLPDAARALTQAVEALSLDETGSPRGLWSGPEGEAAASLIAALIAEGDALPPVTPAAFADIVERLLGAEVVRSAGASHPRLRILGAIEARLVRADRLILAGLDEGVWPQPPSTDPFLSRPMREALGLPSPERRVGLSAHDFAQAACAPEVTLVHRERRGGQPAVESRWLWRLRTLARGAGILALPTRHEVIDWARALDAPLTNAEVALKPAPRPNPTPPVSVRPTAMAVTRVETWVRDPYALYARMILRLSALERPDESVDARLRGTAVHAAFEAFARAHPEVLPEDAETVFRDLLVAELRGAGMTEPRMAREHALATNLAPWVIEFERGRRLDARLLAERKGEVAIMVDGEPFTLSARADRLELRGGQADILDFKTGQPPSPKQVETGLAPQLTLTAAIVARGGFEDLDGRRPGELLYVRVSGGRKPGETRVAAGADDSAAAGEKALEGLATRIRAFRDPAQGYRSKASPQFINQAGDYDHLARVFEWHVMGDADGEGEAA